VRLAVLEKRENEKVEERRLKDDLVNDVNIPTVHRGAETCRHTSHVGGHTLSQALIPSPDTPTLNP
jgi:hypothetical protein